MIQLYNKKSLKWLLFFYSIPSKPVSCRVKIWRKLTKAGALPFKGAVYILPHNEENFEYFQWLVSEVTALGGEGAFVKIDRVETANHIELIHLFNKQREKDYRRIEKGLEEIGRKIDSAKTGGGFPGERRLSEYFNTLMREFEEIRKIDFFSSKMGDDIKKRMKIMESEIKKIAGPNRKKQQVVIVPKSLEDYKGKIWVTRKNPFVDRMASAWLIRTFVDKEAVFQLMEERKMENLNKKNMIFFDVRGGEFTHIGDMCTFEVILKSFGLKDKALKRIAELVHELDIRDGKYKGPEVKGIEEILAGIRKMAKDDKEILEKGMAIFGMLYASKT